MRVFLLSVVLAFQCLQTADFYNGNQIFFPLPVRLSSYACITPIFIAAPSRGGFFCFSVIKKRLLQA
jgi:hypothetical protein